jgi:uncharacterized protein (DUF302 family)
LEDRVQYRAQVKTTTEASMILRNILPAVLLAVVSILPAATQAADEDGIVRVKSAYSMPETIERLKKDVADKGIMFFSEIDQSKLAADAGIKLEPSTLLVFGNPPLGTLFLTSKPAAGLDWPVRLLVYQDERGDVWALYTDFIWIARRHGITDRVEEFAKASEVIASICSAVQSKQM